MKVEYLADRPEFAETVCRWTFDEWGHLTPGYTYEEAFSKLKLRMVKGRLPVSFVAAEGDNPLGTASLFVHDMKTRTDLSPWLAAVFVDPARRRKKIGSALVARVEKEARDLGAETLYLYTPDMMPFYGSMGWEFLDEEEYRGQRVTIMQKKL